MKNGAFSSSARPLGVELLILRILRRGFAGTLVTGAIGAMGCTSDPDADRPTAQEQSPAAATNGADTPRDAGAGIEAGRADPKIDAVVPARSDASASDTDAATAQDASRASTCSATTPDMLRASGLRTVDTFDYVAIRRAVGGYEPGRDAGTALTWTSDAFTTLSETGGSCATATDSTCAETIKHHPAEFVMSYCPQACLEYSVVTTRGNEVKRWATDAELLTLLGKVDTADEALLFALRAGYGSACVTQQPDGLQVVATHYKSTCPVVNERVTLHVSDTGKLEVVSAVELPGEMGSAVCIGRVPAGLHTVSQARHESAVGDYLAHCAHLEDASVYAFERLAHELTASGAPRDLIAASLHAADDEVRHARVLGALARARGGEVVVAEVHTLTLRTLEEIALENATEGCVRETYGALVGGFQARHARDVGVRSAMCDVAADEARHAALSQRVHTWAMAQLDASARERVRSAQRRAIAELARECETEIDARLREPLGLPTAEVAVALLGALSHALWERRESGTEPNLTAAVDSFRRAV